MVKSLTKPVEVSGSRKYSRWLALGERWKGGGNIIILWSQLQPATRVRGVQEKRTSSVPNKKKVKRKREKSLWI